ncbi:hypothetical protein MCNS_29610 [Mycobacterium conspicuum]|uniref:Uncharacterized protein n=1 Tax=Mycobacterium conspicuum TaxID=44010 RepID=A0A7I7YDS9_9MYCO|nr:hypothetical protein MCNS_29610 [Mycobacterium conspicuum]
MSTRRQKSTTAVPGDVCRTSGTNPEIIPGTICACGATRLLTGKSSTTSGLSVSNARTSSAHAAVITDDRRTPKACDNACIPATAAGSSCTGADGCPSRSAAAANR